MGSVMVAIGKYKPHHNCIVMQGVIWKEVDDEAIAHHLTSRALRVASKI
jgi:hypothetical protein